MLESLKAVSNGKPCPPRKAEFFSVPIRGTLVLVCGAPLIGLFLCLALSYGFHDESFRNSTWCPGLQYDLPSVSRAIGVFTPQRHIWIIIMLTVFPPRIFYGFMYRKFYLSSTAPAAKKKWYRAVAWLMTSESIVEMGGLLLLSVVDIQINFPVHAFAFAIWLTCACFYMLFNTVLHYFSGWKDYSKKSNRMFWIKLTVMLVSGTIALSTIFSYPYYMELCSSWAHNLFAACEYLIVLLNLTYHYLPYWDLPDVRLGLFAYFGTLHSSRSLARDMAAVVPAETERLQEESGEKTQAQKPFISIGII